MKYLIALSLLFLVLLSVFSCEPKEEIVIQHPEAELQFSADSVLFDTVFVKTGSVTKRILVYNFNKNAVEIDEIKLGKLDNSAYKIIIDGVETSVARDVRIRGKDSLYVLVKVHIEPAASNLPFLVNDSITFSLNNKIQDVKLVAYGQNAHFYRNQELTCNTVWAADKPHVIFGNIKVKEGCSLTIEKGARIYAHKDAALQVNGTLKIEGTNQERVIFDGDRLEPFYDDIPGQWSGIRFSGNSKNNTIRYADIKNADVAIQAGNPDKDPTSYDIVLENCIIKNMYRAGILSYSADVRAVNTLITNCGQYAIAGFGGGNYDFKCCTIANYTPEFRRDTPSLFFTDRPENEQPAGYLRISMTNSIVWAGKRGNRLAEEILFQNEAGARLDTAFSYNILQTRYYKDLLNKTNIFNLEPGFKSTPETPRNNFKYDYSLDTLAVANGAAQPLPKIIKDLKDVARDVSKPDIGAYERLEPQL